MAHLCHHPTCELPVPPRMLACRPHWYQLPKSIRDLIWNTYTDGQEITKDPTEAYMRAFQQAQDFWKSKIAS